jgi:hypothetical protein
MLLYVIAWVAIPSAPRQPQATASGFGAGGGPSDGAPDSAGSAPDSAGTAANATGQSRYGGQRVLGIILIVVGALFLLDRFSWWRWPRWGSILSWWPAALIVAGAYMGFGAKNRNRT